MNAALLAATLDAIVALIQRGDFPGAETRAQGALQNLPPHAEVWRLLAIAQLKGGKIDAARRSLEQANRLDPLSVEVLYNLATVESHGGNRPAAEALLERALELAPNHIGALGDLGRLRHRLGDFARALQCFERCVRADRGRAQSWFDLANTNIAMQQWQAAEANVRQGLSLAPNSPDGWYVLGYLYERQGRFQDAVQPYRKSMELGARPGTAHNLALVLEQVGDLQGGAGLMEYAVRLAPNLYEGLSHLVYTKRKLCDWDGLPELGARLIAAVDAGVQGIGPFALLAENVTPAQQLRCARTFANGLKRATDWPNGSPNHAALSSARRPGQLRVGFVSSGFNRHATGLLVVELIERLRASSLTTVAFATAPDDGSDLRRRLMSAFGEFYDVAGQSPETIAQKVRAAHIDILIDVDGYCMGSLPRVFALEPAPIQINWLAYPGSLGAPWYDYLIADAYVIPPPQREYYDEKIACLPRCYQPTDTTRVIAEPPPRQALGLPANGFVYCCFNANWKITPQTFALWMRILRDVPDSVLWLLDERPASGAPERLRAAAQRADVDPQRLVFAAKADHPDYLARYRHASLFLDTNPYNAHTTASDALYVGCPVLTRPGVTFTSRVAGSLNRQIGLDELIVDEDEAYVARAIELARAPERLDALAARLRDASTRARLFDMQAYANDFATLLTRIAERAHAGLPPQDISL
jgi:predicted O-linked N-acetylglucosamine transferase (SPINDLY family)